MKGARLYRGALFAFVKLGKSDVDFSNRASFSSSVFPPFVVITAWVTIINVVGPAMVWAAQALVRSGWRASLLRGWLTSVQGQFEPKMPAVHCGNS
jgi:hypothetical protein